MKIEEMQLNAKACECCIPFKIKKQQQTNKALSEFIGDRPNTKRRQAKHLLLLD
jgi:hypothetical protein